MTDKAPNLYVELSLLGLLALLWGSSYLFVNVAVQTIPPITLGAIRVSIAALMLGGILVFRRVSLPRDLMVWGRLFWQSILASTGAWTVLAWGQ
ncbi:MAG: EamA family transporter, partial [Rhodobacteraceae bacterium]|nr:EamA family transporter [Paracoccaceae bacterium]